MLISVICRFQDDGVQLVDDQYIDLQGATSAALDLANLHGNDNGDGHGPPKSFDVYVDGSIELSVAVFRGGLVPPSFAKPK